MNKKIVVVCGPTGIGKTGFAIKLAGAVNGEIVGADSMQIYRKMDIGTAKPDEEERAMARHHLVDVVDPDESFDAARFVGMADRAVSDIHGRNRRVIVAGGTGLYIKALVHGLFRARAADPAVMERLETEGRTRGDGFLHARLAACDPDTAAGIHPHDRFRLIRALEFFESTGKPISSRRRDHNFATLRYDAMKIGLYMEREKLYQRINKRVDLMISGGLIEEVEGLLRAGYSCELKSMQSIGYRHICDFLKGAVTYEETLRLLKRDTRRYAKRQFTWFRKDKDVRWFKPGETELALKEVKKFLG